MKTLSRTEIFKASAEDVFKAIDDLGVTGTHMTKSSMMMMGSKLELKYLTSHQTGLGSKYRWTGKMMGLKMDFTVEVTKWIKGKEKVWETVGDTKLIIYSWYQMVLKMRPIDSQTKTVLSISYKKPSGIINQILSFLFADWYCRWCLRKMLEDARTNIQLAKTDTAGTLIIEAVNE